MSSAFVGEIRMFGGNFAPRNWAFCWGQTISIASNSALFALLGTTYGGNGQTTFALPDLRGRVPVGMGQGPGLPDVTQGEVSGTPTLTLTTNNLPAHTHVVSGNVPASSGMGTLTSPGAGAIPAASNQRNAQYAASGNADTSLPLSNLSVSASGNNIPISLMQPYLGMNYIICLYGIFPSRN